MGTPPGCRRVEILSVKPQKNFLLLRVCVKDVGEDRRIFGPCAYVRGVDTGHKRLVTRGPYVSASDDDDDDDQQFVKGDARTS
jgi:hypothetical protein